MAHAGMTTCHGSPNQVSNCKSETRTHQEMDDEEGEQDEEEEEQAVQRGAQSIDGLRAQYPVRALEAGHALFPGNTRVLAGSGFVVLP